MSALRSRALPNNISDVPLLFDTIDSTVSSDEA
jgi:hypothetical protein